MINPREYQESMTLAGPVHVLEASAGTGKTHAVANLVVRHLLEPRPAKKGKKGEPWQIGEILVVTFTEAAVAELKERIRRQIRSTVLALETGRNLNEISSKHALTPARRTDAIRRLELALSSYDEAPIFTIHGFCKRVLRQFAFESQTEFDLEFMKDSGELLEEVVADYWARHIATRDEALLAFLEERGCTPGELRAAVRAKVADPHLELWGDAPGDAVEAPTEQWQRLQQELRTSLEDEWRRLAESLRPKREAEWLRWRTVLRDYVTAFHPTGQPLPDVVVDFGVGLRDLSLGPGGEGEPIRARTPALVNELNDLALACEARFPDEGARLVARAIESCAAEFHRRKKVRHLLTFDDLIQQLAQTLTSSGRSLAPAIRSRYPVAIIDEFQDTDATQWKIFETLYATEGRLFLVGDPKQAIYGFRGADVNAYLSAARQFEPLSLSTNRRSTEQLVSVLNELYSPRRLANPFVIDEIQYQPVKSAEPPPPVSSTGTNLAPFKILGIQNQTRTELTRERARRACERATAADIARLLASRATIGDRLVTPRSIAILTRKNDESLRMQQALRAHGIRGVLRATKNVFETDEARDLSDLMRAVSEPTRRDWVRAALGGRLINLDVRALNRLLDDDVAWTAEVEKFRAWHNVWQERGFASFMREFLASGNLTESILRRENGERVMTNLLQMTELLYATERSLGLGMLELRRRFEQKKIADPNAEPELRMESDEDAVQIMTIFRSKGLQFDVVYCPLLWEPPQENRQRFPRFMRNKRRHLCISLDKRRPDDVKRSLELERREEDARLLYVALTRAKSRLVLTWGRIKGAGTSPLAHLLHPGEQGTFAPAKYNALNHDGIARHLSAFADTVPGVEVEWVETGGSDDALVSIAPRELELVSRDFTRVLDRRWRLESYSRLSRGKSHPEHTPERDDEAGAERIEDSVEVESRSIDLQQLPAVPTAGGVRFGLFVHHLFEFLAFDAPREAVEKFAAESVAQFQIDDEARAYGVELFLATVSAELPLRKGLRVRLDALPRDRQLREARFTLPVRANPAGVTPARLAEVFARHDHGRFPGLVARIAELGFEEFEGYLRGTIDLAFEHEGRWYVVDYKTNRLGAFLSDYDDAGLHRAMLEGQYYLQYHLYLVAMRRLLRWRVPNLGEDWIGGVGYLFLRGLASEGRRNHGVMVDVPDAALIRDLSALFSEEAP